MFTKMNHACVFVLDLQISLTAIKDGMMFRNGADLRSRTATKPCSKTTRRIGIRSARKAGSDLIYPARKIFTE